MMKKINDDVMSEMLTSLADSFTNERKKTEPYKELFKAGSSFTRLLRTLESQMMRSVLDACTVYKEKNGKSLNKNQFNVLLALPLLVKVAENNASANEGMACCVDKAYYMVSEQLIKLGEDE